MRTQPSPVFDPKDYKPEYKAHKVLETFNNLFRDACGREPDEPVAMDDAVWLGETAADLGVDVRFYVTSWLCGILRKQIASDPIKVRTLFTKATWHQVRRHARLCRRKFRTVEPYYLLLSLRVPFRDGGRSEKPDWFGWYRRHLQEYEDYRYRGTMHIESLRRLAAYEPVKCKTSSVVMSGGRAWRARPR